MPRAVSVHLALPGAPRSPRVRFSVPTLMAALLAAGCLLLSATTPAITGPAPGQAVSGSLVMREQSRGHTCTSDISSQVTLDASSCAAVNELGGGTPMIPGRSVTDQVTITNTGTTDAATIALTAAGGCTQTPSSTVADLCTKVMVTISSGIITVFHGTAEKLGHATGRQLRMPAPPAANQEVEFTFTATLDPTAGNEYMGLQTYLPISWTLAA